MKNSIEIGFQEKKITITPLEYEFKGTNDSYDANWLNVKVQILHENINYSIVDPFILTTELQELLNWFNEVDDTDGNKTFEFLESGMKIEFNKKEADFSFIFTWNLHPFGVDYYSRTNQDFVIKFNKVELDINNIVSQISLLITEFPTIKF